MGMNIEETIKTVESAKRFAYDEKYEETFDSAINIMRKYQKIQEIFYRYDKGELTHNMFGLLVGEVLEDGDD